MAEKFEVGKSYRISDTVPPIDVLFVGKFKTFVREHYSEEYGGRELVLHNTDCLYYKEYHEPKVEKFVKYVLRYKGETPITTCRRGPEAYDLIGKMEITLTDGKLTSVELME